MIVGSGSIVRKERCSLRAIRNVVALTTGLVLSLVAMAPATSATSPQVAPKVVNGTPASAADLPWQALLMIGSGSNRALCSGALISPTTIASVAHCLQGVAPGDVKVWMGESKLSEAKPSEAIPVAGLVVHPGFDAQSLVNDIALVQLARPVDLTTGARVIALPFGQDPATWPGAGAAATISGWGATSNNGRESDQLLRGEVQVLGDPSAICGQYGAAFNASMLICGGLPNGAVDTCQGDSGGPFTVTVGGIPVLAGLTSNGVDCASSVYPGLYTRMTTFLPWIQQAADVATAPPGQPTGITAAPKSRQTEVMWTAPVGTGAASTVWTVTAQPGGATCRTTGSSCLIPGLKAGHMATFTVQGSGPFGAGPAGTSEPTRIFNGQVRRGTAASARTVATIAGLRGQARMVSRTKGTCVVRGSQVRFLSSGTCGLVVAAQGKRRQVFISVT